MSSRKLGRKSIPRGQLFILGGILVFVAHTIYLEPRVLGEYQIVGKDGRLAANNNKTGIDVLEPLTNITVVSVANDVERTQLIALAQFAHEICSSKGLDIFAMGGTLLGSMRHHDFIPWDDDMDFIVVIDNMSQIMEIHDEFEKRGSAMPHPKFGLIGKTKNLTPHCWNQKTCNVTEELPHGRPFLGMFRTHFMNSTKVGWRYDYNCTKEDDRWCSRWPSVDIFLFLKTKEQLLQNIVGWPGPKTLSVQDVFPLRDILLHGTLFKAPSKPGHFLSRYGYGEKDWEFGKCNGGGNHRGGGQTHFKANCTQLWDQIPFVRHREQTENETVEIAYMNNTVVSVLRLNEKGESTCHATMLSDQRNECGVEVGSVLPTQAFNSASPISNGHSSIMIVVVSWLGLRALAVFML